jgi:hypothetical protein
MLSTTHYWGGDGRNQYSCDKHITVCMEMDIWLEDAADLFCFVPLPPSRHWDWEGLIDEHLPYLCSICRESRRALYPTIGTTMYISSYHGVLSFMRSRSVITEIYCWVTNV